MRDNTGPGLALEDSAAGKVFFDASHLTYARLMNEIVPLVGKKDPLATMREMAKISAAFRANYEKAAMIAAPWETKSDTFFFVEDRLVIHNRAEYSYAPL